MDEAALLEQKAWTEVIRPTLSDRKGRATFVSTPKGRNWFHRLAYGDPDTGWLGAFGNPDWFTMSLKASESGLIEPDELNDARRGMSEEEYEQEYECSFDAAIRGAYYAAAFRRVDAEGRIREVPVDRYRPVDTAWDLGRSDSTVIWFFQRSGREVWVVDYYEADGVGLDHYAEVLRAKKEATEWFYGTHYLPHDVRVTELTTDKSRLNTLYGLGVRPIVVVPRHNVNEGINASRRMLDRCFFDRKRTLVGVDHLRLYREKTDKTGRIRLGVPEDKEGNDHAADAFRQYAAMLVDLPVTERERYARKRYKAKHEDKTSWMGA